MLNQSLRSKIDGLWLEFHSGGITNPITVIEQISYLMFIRLLDLSEARNEKRAARLKKPYKGHFPKSKRHLRWSEFRNQGGDRMLEIVRDEVFPFMRTELQGKTALGSFLKDANCLIPSGNLLVRAVNAIEELPLTQGDTKGDLYEYLLGKLSTAGIAGQFRTPRHVIRAMVDMMAPKPTETICDPACGTAGFPVGVMDYLKEQYSSPELVEEEKTEDGKIEKHYPGDLLDPYRKHIENGMFTGFDFDSTMLRIAAMNLLLHGIESPCIHYQDTLSSTFSERFPKLSHDSFDLALANPPFKGTIDMESVDPELKSKVKTKKSELLFIVLMLRILKQGGRCAIIVPDGVLFGSSQAHVTVRKMLVDDNQLEGVVSLPGGVFKPYAGVQTAILIFTKGGRTDNVWFYKVEGDGYSLDDRRTEQPEKNDLPDLVEQWKKRKETRNAERGTRNAERGTGNAERGTRNGKRGTRKAKGEASTPSSEFPVPSSNPPSRSTKSFHVPVSEIRDNKYDLSVNRYKETPYEETTYDPPEVILKRMRKLEQEILKDMDELEGMLK